MKNRADNKRYELTDFSKLSNEELAEAFIFPSKKPVTLKEKQEEAIFWQERRKQFANRTPQQQVFDRLLQRAACCEGPLFAQNPGSSV